MAKEYLSTFKSLKAKEKARLSSPMAPAVRHTFRGLMITKLIHTKIIKPLNVCPTQGFLFYDTNARIMCKV